MSSKGAITITHDELIRMKMRANVIPNRNTSSIQLDQKIIYHYININKAKKEQISGPITLKTSKKEKKKKDSKNFRKKSWKEEKLMKKKDDSNKKRKNNS